MDTEGIRSRLNEVCSVLYEGNQAEMARILGWQRVTLRYILSGHTKKIDSRLLDAVVQEGVSQNWLMTGQGAMISDGDKEAGVAISRIIDLIDRYDKEMDDLDGEAAGAKARMLLMAIAKEMRPLAQGDKELLDQLDDVEKNIIANAFR